jgi:exodeoxyribonuclease V alpha subunit
VDILRWMSSEHPDCVAELQTCMRVSQGSDGAVRFSKGLELAAGYRDEGGLSDDAVLSELVQKRESGDTRIAFWTDHV